jgi:uncharacterized protein (TIGR02594 family)
MPMSQDQPAWLSPAWVELGQHELLGTPANPRIRDLYADAHHSEITSDEVAWCAAYVSACLERAKIPSTRSLLARDYLAWGGALDTPRLGAIAVLSRDPDPNAGHVAFLIGQTADQLILLGGNQSNAVTVQAFPKSRLLSLRWPSPTAAAASPPSVPTAPNPLFDRALTHVLEMEGGYTNDPADPGGPTNFGITLAGYARSTKTTVTASNRDALTYALQHIALAHVRAIYLGNYWLPSGCPHLPPALAFFHFDTAVNMGTGTAIRMLQTALAQIAPDCQIDGEPGPQTQAAARRADPSLALSAYAELRRRRYRSLAGFPRFGRGWLRRVDTTLARALSLITTGTPAMTIENTASAAEPKWWGQSLTIWGAVVTGLAAVLPAVGPAFGLNVSPATVHTAADQIMGIAQALTGLAGTLAAIYGRTRAIQPLIQRTVTLKV